MTEEIRSSPPGWRHIVTASFLATFWALAVTLGVSTLLMALTIGGFIVIVLVVMDAVRLMTTILFGLSLVGPITLLVLPALALLGHRRPHLSRGILLVIGPLAGAGWGAVMAACWFDESRTAGHLLATLGMIGGLTAGIIFTRHVPRERKS